jgi:methylase of polypeptide subunit release factors
LNEGVIPVPDPTLCAALAADLAEASYTAARLRGLWGVAADEAWGRGRTLPARRALAGSQAPAATLARLFCLGESVSREDVDAALPRTRVAGLHALGLTALGDDGLVHPLASVRPQAYVDDQGAGEWWVASDLDEAVLRGPLPEDHVLGVGGASMTLAGLQLPTPAARVLDVGTGCGIQALRARRVADRVVATDISEGALRFTRMNALINGVPGIDARAGSLFAPVAGEVFDRIVSNPPFVITPRREGVPAYAYRDGGLVGDALVKAFVRGVGAHLVDGGTAQLLGNWEYRDGSGGDGLERVRAWVEKSGVPLDAWVIERERLDPIAYAELWIRDGGTVAGSDAYDELLGAWLDDFTHRGVREVGFGYVLLRRRRPGMPALGRYERVATAVSEGSLGAHLAACLEAHDRQVVLDDAGLAASTLRVAPDVTEARHLVPGAADPSVIELRQGGGFGRTLSVDPALAGVVGACDGDLPLGTLIDAVADLLEVEAGMLRADLLPRVRGLIDDGMLLLADAERAGG